jgi:hypothetical protein
VAHENVWIKLFVFSLEGNPKKWIKYCSSPRKISSFAELIHLFLKRWDPYYDKGKYEEILEYLTTIFHKEQMCEEEEEALDISPDDEETTKENVDNVRSENQGIIEAYDDIIVVLED